MLVLKGLFRVLLTKSRGGDKGNLALGSQAASFSWHFFDSPGNFGVSFWLQSLADSEEGSEGGRPEMMPGKVFRILVDSPGLSC